MLEKFKVFQDAVLAGILMSLEARFSYRWTVVI